MHINRCTVLEIDQTLEGQELLHNYALDVIHLSDLKSTQGYCSDESFAEIGKRLCRFQNQTTLIGNGNYHYITYHLLAQIKEPFALVLFDHHTDCMPYESGDTISCGSWVSKALQELSNLKRVVIVGARVEDEYLDPRVRVISEEEVNDGAIKTIEHRIKEHIEHLPVYVSVDKDVLYPNDAHTNWDQGSMTLLQLLYLLRELNKSERMLGLDICGELPLTQTERWRDGSSEELRKNEIANRAILDIVELSAKREAKNEEKTG
jgi:arginase family enzyme